LIARRSRSAFVPQDVASVRRRFEKVIREAAKKAEATSIHASLPLKPSPFSIRALRKKSA